MSLFKFAPKNLKNVLLDVFVVSAGFVLLFALVGVFLVARSGYEHEQIRHNDGLSLAAVELLKPAMTISDFGEAQRILGLLTEKNVRVFGIVTPEGDLLLHDYQDRGLFSEIVKDKRILNCASVRKQLKQVIYDEKKYDIYCSDLKALAIGEPSHFLGTMVYLQSNEKFDFPLRLALVPFLLVLGTSLVSLVIFRDRLNRFIIHPFERLVKNLNESAAHPLDPPSLDRQKDRTDAFEKIQELATLQSAFDKVIKSFREEYLRRTATERKFAVEELAHQVAHDIRSPLAALSAALPFLKLLPEDERILVESAIDRIRNIANSLLLAKTGTGADEERSQSHFIPDILRAIVSEKALQYGHLNQIEIQLQIENEKEMYAVVQLTEFQRVLSNIINNAVESLGSKGKVDVNLAASSSTIEITVTDTGAGMSEAVLRELLTAGGTFNKPGGSGLGLSHAKKYLEKWRGSIGIESSLGKGTEVKMLLPRETPTRLEVSNL